MTALAPPDNVETRDLTVSFGRAGEVKGEVDVTWQPGRSHPFGRTARNGELGFNEDRLLCADAKMDPVGKVGRPQPPMPGPKPTGRIPQGWTARARPAKP